MTTDRGKTKAFACNAYVHERGLQWIERESEERNIEFWLTAYDAYKRSLRI